MKAIQLTFDVFPLIMHYIRLQGYSTGNTQELNGLVNAIEKNNLKGIFKTEIR